MYVRGLQEAYLLILVVRLLDRADDGPREGERREHEDPRREVLVQERGRDGVHAERACGPRGLQGFVHAGVPRELEGVVCERGHDPVCERLVARVREVVCAHEEATTSACLSMYPTGNESKRGDSQKK